MTEAISWSSLKLKVNDAVTVSRENQQYEGVIVYVSSNKIGVRLTGNSVGQGDTDGRPYFDCPTDCGLLCTPQNTDTIVVRQLTRLQELKLRRELKTTTATTKSATSRTPPRRVATAIAAASPSTTTTASKTASTKTTSSSKKPIPQQQEQQAGATTTKMTKLEEIRQRREALRQKRSSPAKTTTAAASSTKQTTTDQQQPAASLSSVDATLQSQVTMLQHQLKQKESQHQQLQETLDQTNASHSQQLQQLQSQLEQQQKQQQKQHQPNVETPTKTTLTETLERTQSQHRALLSERDQLLSQLDELQSTLRAKETQCQAAETNLETIKTQLTTSNAQATAYQTQLEKTLAQQPQQTTTKLSSDHYKERAKLTAELTTLQSTLERYQREQLDLEQTLEELTLDKEALLTEKEEWTDQREEMKLDLETARMEVEELQHELAVAAQQQDYQQPSTNNESSTSTDAQHQQSQQLSFQNARLRQALIRLREQSSLETLQFKKELQQLKQAAAASQDVSNQVSSLTAANAKYQEEIEFLKERLEEGAAYESMVEDLSDRVLELEHELQNRGTMIAQLEEASELQSEMEEVQAEELQSLYLDLDGRDTIIRNMEEAIVTQRRREEDFRRTVSNYKSTVETLKQEKSALLELQRGGEGEKSNLLANSQAALSRAAQLVADAASLRQREAQTVLSTIDNTVHRDMSTRFESLLPLSVVQNEVAAIKGELATAKCLSKASLTLQGIKASFKKIIRPALPADETSGDAESIIISDDVKQQVASLFHQTEFASLIADASSDLLRLLTAGQWPDLLAPELSTELGSVMGHCLSELDAVLGMVLKSLTEEGALTIEQSNVGDLRLALQNTMQMVRSDMERKDGPIVPTKWHPPGWKLFKDASVSSFLCLGAASALSVLLESQSNGDVASLYNKIEQCCIQTASVCIRLKGLDINNDRLVDEFTALTGELHQKASKLVEAVQALFDTSEFSGSLSATDDVLQHLGKMTTFIRAESLPLNDDESFHPFSPEASDPWNGVASVVQEVRGIDGDDEDVNFLLRARAIDERLTNAVENEPKLATATARVSSLEKSLASRSKEIAMQNARLSELEQLVAKSSATPLGRGKGFDTTSSEEFIKVKEENRMLNEAMEVLQSEVEMYETEIRALKDFKSPSGKRGSNRTPRRSVPVGSEFGSREDLKHVGALEATLFRPALQEALAEASKWKSSAFAEAMESLPVLPVLSAPSGGLSDDWHRLSSALASSRLQKASIKVVDLTKDESPREQLRNLKETNAASSARLHALVNQFQARLQ